MGVVIEAAKRFREKATNNKYEITDVQRQDDFWLLDVKLYGSKNPSACVAVSTLTFPNADFKKGEVLELKLGEGVIHLTDSRKIAKPVRHYSKIRAQEVTELDRPQFVGCSHFKIEGAMDFEGSPFVFAELRPYGNEDAPLIQVAIHRGSIGNSAIDAGSIIHAQINFKGERVPIPHFEGRAYEVETFTIVIGHALAKQSSNPSGRPKTP
jgi:hypothetical protein